MELIKMKILGLSYSLSNKSSYIVILSEGERKLPIVIKPQDASLISMKMENTKTIMPSTHDLIKTICDNTKTSIESIIVHNLVEGLFYTKLNFIGENDFSIDCSIGDAICFSMMYKLPIYVNEEILEKSGRYMNDDGTISEEQNIKNSSPRKRKITIEQLQAQLDKSLDDEDYEKATMLRDKIDSMKKKKVQNKNKD